MMFSGSSQSELAVLSATGTALGSEALAVSAVAVETDSNLLVVLEGFLIGVLRGFLVGMFEVFLLALEDFLALLRKAGYGITGEFM
jgi:hypothetical protein